MATPFSYDLRPNSAAGALMRPGCSATRDAPLTQGYPRLPPHFGLRLARQGAASSLPRRKLADERSAGERRRNTLTVVRHGRLARAAGSCRSQTATRPGRNPDTVERGAVRELSGHVRPRRRRRRPTRAPPSHRARSLDSSDATKRALASTSHRPIVPHRAARGRGGEISPTDQSCPLPSRRLCGDRNASML